MSKTKNGHFKCNKCGAIKKHEEEQSCLQCGGEMIFIGYRTDVTTKNNRGQFVPCILEPYFLSFGRVKCDCGRKFKNKKSYREHYALEHILGLD